MAWNEVPAKDDANLRIQAYYIRPNPVASLLSPLGREVFLRSWSQLGTDGSSILHRSTLAGEVLSDLVRALAMRELTEGDPLVGQWFVHSGETIYPDHDWGGPATIYLDDGQSISSAIRSECIVSNSALANMCGTDDISFVVGRRISTTRFDLVGAGYREVYAYTHPNAPRTLNLVPDGVSLLAKQINKSRLPNLLPEVQLGDAGDDVALMRAVDDTVNRFADAVEQEGGWRLLSRPDSEVPVHEVQHQMLFQIFSRLVFSALRIQVHPHANHGRGATDLTLTLGSARHIVEFKKDSTLTALKHGLEVQLPLYMRSSGAKNGSYVIMCHRRTKDDVREHLSKCHPDPAGNILVYAVDCRPQQSASVA